MKRSLEVGQRTWKSLQVLMLVVLLVSTAVVSVLMLALSLAPTNVSAASGATAPDAKRGIEQAGRLSGSRGRADPIDYSPNIPLPATPGCGLAWYAANTPRQGS